MKKGKLLFIVALCGVILPLKAQFTLSGEIRPRSEFRHGFKMLVNDDTEAAFFTEQRSRIIATYQNNYLKTKVSLQDVRIWGSVNQVYKSDPALTSLNEAWLDFAITPLMNMKVGRQEFNYDNARFLGNLGWAQQSRSHDALLLTYSDSSYVLHVGGAFNQDAGIPEFAKLTSTFYEGVNNYKTLQFAWFHKDFTNAGLSLLVLNNGVQTGTADSSFTRFSQTYGFVGNTKIGGFGLEGEFYYQGGKDPSNTDLNAFLVAANVSYAIGKKFVPSVGVDYLSGTEAGSSENNSFTPLYGTNHKFYGLMDYFYVGNPHGNVGLIDIYLKSKNTLTDKIALITHLHQFLSAVTITDPGGSNADKFLGTELDLVLNINLKEAVNLKLGYSQMFATETMEIIKGSGDAGATNNWAWVMITANPTLFTSK